MTEKTKTVELADNKALAVLGDEERQMAEGVQDKVNRCIPFKDGLPMSTDGKPEILSYALLMDTCKTSNITGALQTVANAATGQNWNNPDTCLAVAYSQMADLEPRTPLEAMLISQMVAVNSTVGTLMERGMLKDQTFEGRQMNLTLATKFQRTFLMQIDALEKLRGKGQQTVRVEHVTVNAGGQAIVGHIEHKPGGGGGK